MRVLISVFTSLILVVIAFLQNTVPTFAMQENSFMEMGNIILSNDCYGNAISSDLNCNHDCCIEPDSTDIIKAPFFSRTNNEKIKINVKTYILTNNFSLNSFCYKNPIKITSPPQQIREIKNYSYKDLTKIIKSNS